jgi:flagellar biosynthesis GTPase FlhF
VDLHETDNSELSASIASTSLPTIVLSNEEKAKKLEEKKQRKEERKKKREARQKKKEAQRRLEEKMQRKEARKLKREARKRREEAKKKKKLEEAKSSNTSSSELSSSTKDGYNDESYQVSKGGKKESKGMGSDNKYAAISFDFSSMTYNDGRSFINVPAGKLPRFDGTNFAKWKHLMRDYLVSLHSGIWEIVCNGVEPLVDPKNPTRAKICNIHLNGQATSVLLSALDGDEYNGVM